MACTSSRSEHSARSRSALRLRYTLCSSSHVACSSCWHLARRCCSCQIPPLLKPRACAAGAPTVTVAYAASDVPSVGAAGSGRVAEPEAVAVEAAAEEEATEAMPVVSDGSGGSYASMCGCVMALAG